MSTFLVLYLAPVAVLEDWSKLDPEKRKPAEDKMRGEWVQWMTDHGNIITDTKACRKTKRVSPDGITDTKNDIMLYSVVEADSHEAATKAFANHPHLQIPQASIEVMEINALTGM